MPNDKLKDAFSKIGESIEKEKLNQQREDNVSLQSEMVKSVAAIATHLSNVKGEKGDKGDKGDKGEEGDKGNRGEKGDRGIQGLKGDKGDKGNRGAKGDRGERGLPGAKGDKGDKGDIGIGLPGRDGKDGKDGKDYSGVVYGEGEPDDDTGYENQIYIDTESFDAYVKRIYGWVLKSRKKKSQPIALPGSNSSSTGITDGDKGDITVSGSGAVWTIDNAVVTIPKISASGVASSSTFLRGDGSWTAVSASPGGSSGQVQFNNSGSFAGDSAFFWDNTSKELGLGTILPAARIHATAPSTTIPAIIGQASAGQTTNIQEWQNSAGVVGGRITSAREFSFPCTTGTAFPGEKFGAGAAPNVTAGTVANTVIGQEAGSSLSTGAHNTLLGFQAGAGLTTGTDNVIVGSQVNAPAGLVTAVAIGRQNDLTNVGFRPIIIGAGIFPLAGTNDCIFLGANCHGEYANRFYTGPHQHTHTLMGITTITARSMAEIGRDVVDGTDATRTGRLTLKAFNVATSQEGMRVEGNPSGVRVGFYGGNAVAKPSSTSDIRQALIDLGLYTTGGASPLNLNGGRLTAGGVSAAIITTSLDITLSDSHYTVLVDASTANRIVNLPAASASSGRIYNIKKTDSSANTVTIDGNASETIDGALTQVISIQYNSLEIQCNGSSWFII